MFKITIFFRKSTRISALAKIIGSYNHYVQINTGNIRNKIDIRYFSKIVSDGNDNKDPVKLDGTSINSPAKKVLKEEVLTTAEAIALATKHYSHEINRAYGDMERVLMARIQESNIKRFRVILISILLVLFWTVAVFGGNIRKMLTDQTAGLARETLENESLKIQTQELATAVVNTVLNDADVTAHAAHFLREASSAPETQEALLKLTIHVLQHKDSLQEVLILVGKVLGNLCKDKETVSQLASLLGSALEDPQLQEVLSHVVQELSKDPKILQAVSDATVLVLQQPEVVKATNDLLVKASMKVLDDGQVLRQARDFVTDVMGDDSLQREGGHALVNTITHAIKPGITRVVGLGLMAGSIGLMQIIFSRY